MSSWHFNWARYNVYLREFKWAFEREPRMMFFVALLLFCYFSPLSRLYQNSEMRKFNDIIPKKSSFVWRLSRCSSSSASIKPNQQQKQRHSNREIKVMLTNTFLKLFSHSQVICSLESTGFHSTLKHPPTRQTQSDKRLKGRVGEEF